MPLLFIDSWYSWQIAVASEQALGSAGLCGRTCSLTHIVAGHGGRGGVKQIRCCAGCVVVFFPGVGVDLGVTEGDVSVVDRRQESKTTGRRDVTVRGRR